MKIRPHTVGIVVKDMPAAMTFYRALGLTIPPGEEHAPHVEYAAEGYNIGFTTEALTRGASPDWIEPIGQRVTLGFMLEAPRDVDTLYTQMTEAGHAGVKAPWDAFWGQRYAFLQDPDHNRVDIFAPLPADDA